MGAKWLRIFDLRQNARGPVATWSSRSVFDINSNPFNGYQFASHGDDGVIQLFDLRKTSDTLLSFSEVDAGAVGARLRPTCKPLAQISWSPTRRGMLAALDRDSNAMRIWNLADGMVAQLETPDEGTAKDGAGEENKKAPVLRMGSDELRLPVLLDDQQSESGPHRRSLDTDIVPPLRRPLPASPRFLRIRPLFDFLLDALRRRLPRHFQP
mgnify:FL=1